VEFIEGRSPTDIPDVLVGQIVPEGPIDSQISNKNNAFCRQIGHPVAFGVRLPIFD
jgi:hypothetical protein